MIIDVSYAQGKIDWAKVAKDKNVEGVIIQVGYGQNIARQDDTQFKNNVNGCIKYGIPFGLYLYSYAKTVAAVKGEAEHMIRLANTVKNKISLPLYYDIEEPGTGQGSLQRFNAWAKLIKAAGYVPGLYTGEYWFNAYIHSAVKYTVWVAKYGTNNGTPQSKPNIGGYDYDLWQYTSKAKVSGIKGGVDASLIMDKSIFKNIKKEDKKEDKKTTEKKCKVKAKSGLNCRAKASQKSDIVGAFNDGATLTLLEKTSATWYKVKGKASNGSTITGYVSAKYVEILS